MVLVAGTAERGCAARFAELPDGTNGDDGTEPAAAKGVSGFRAPLDGAKDGRVGSRYHPGSNDPADVKHLVSLTDLNGGGHGGRDPGVLSWG